MDYDWLKDDRKFSEAKLSPKMLKKFLKKNFEKVFLNERKWLQEMAA